MANPQESFTAVQLTPGTLLHGRRTAVARTTLLYQLDVLKTTGRYDAFKLEWHPSYSDPPNVWPVPNHLFWDSDVGKWIEGACYFLMSTSDIAERDTIQSAVDELIAMIAKAQQPDGYLNIHYTVVAPGLRFTNLRDMHELYNCGHLIEAALAHDSLVAPKFSLLLETMVKYVDLLCTLFGPAAHQMHGYPGHPEIELALVRLYKRTGSIKHLALASYFLTERGNPTGSLGEHFYLTEATRRGEDPHSTPSFMGEHNAFWYHQAHLPITQQTEIKGHSVRAMYLLTAAADLCLVRPESPNGELLRATRRLWNDMVTRKMYLTGGIGAMAQWEGFGLPHFLPQSTDEGGCYAETCASIGIMMLAERLLQFELDGNVADIMELALYNTVLAGMSTDGKKFTYVNQLASSEGNSTLREEWFTCACCPPNVLRCLGMLGGYIYTFRETAENSLRVNGTERNGAHIYTNGDLHPTARDEEEQEEATITTHLFISSNGRWTTSSGHEITLAQKSNYPWAGDVEFFLENNNNRKVGLNIRIPAWANHGWSLSPTPRTRLFPRNGYLHLPPSYLQQQQQHSGSFTLSLPLHPRLIAPHTLSSSAHTLTVARGPIIYCVEDADNEPLGVPVHDHFRGLHLDARSCMQGASGSGSASVVEREVGFGGGRVGKGDSGAGGADGDGDGDSGEVEEGYVEITLTEGVKWVDLAGAKVPGVGVGPGREVVATSHVDGHGNDHGNGNGNSNGITDGTVAGKDERNGTVAADAAAEGPEVRQLEKLVFVPFYYRANRKASKGVSRVGLRRWYG